MSPRTCATAPCGSCPYRRDVPAGIWDASEYHKLARYDGDTMGQDPSLFLCHQQDGKLCAGWVGCHGGQLLALRLHSISGQVDWGVFDYRSPVALFSSGAEARDHGLSGVATPSAQAVRAITKLTKRKGEAA